MSNEILDELNSSFVSPERTFKDKTLAPYTEGSRLLLLQIRDNGDSSIYFIYSFIFIHILLKENRKEAINLCWDKEKFRERLFDWISGHSESDLSKASSIVSQMIEEAIRGRVEIISSGQTQGNE
ncbi:hypothetical protein EBR03_09405 [bacterium]|nr:hypothetical protein [bacterium]